MDRAVVLMYRIPNHSPIPQSGYSTLSGPSPFSLYNPKDELGLHQIKLPTEQSDDWELMFEMESDDTIFHIDFALLFSNAGGFQAPLNASSLGQYNRMITIKPAAGAGSQLDSFSIPGDSCCR